MYHIPCTFGKISIGETVQKLETKVKEHQDACEKGVTERLNMHGRTLPFTWEDAALVDQKKELMLKEAPTAIREHHFKQT